MTVLTWDNVGAGARRDNGRLVNVAATLAFIGLVVARLAIQFRTAGALYFEDDAYYYTVIAHNIAQAGLSTFDGQTLTNGYHPLWLAILVVQDLLVGQSIYITIAIELGLAAGGVWLMTGTFRTNSVLLKFAFAVALAIATRPFIAKGMEVSLLLFAIGLFTRTLMNYRAGAATAVKLGLAAAFCIGARIDSAVFVLPAVLLAVGSVRGLVLACVPLAIAGLLYAGVNLLVFGIAFPISGAVKSLGGLQINWRLLHQIGGEIAPAGHSSVFAFANGLIGRCLLCFGLCCLAFPIIQSGSKGRLLAAGYILGLLAFGAKLLFASSWMVWPWYMFPVIFGLVALFHCADDFFTDRRFGVPNILQSPITAQLVAAALLVIGAGWQLRAGAARAEPSFEQINRMALTQLAPVLRGERIAMGDRAGSVAAYYTGPVTQLEGLVNDTAYLDALKKGGDLKSLLCARGVRFVFSFQQDLGSYQAITIPVIRPWLTSFKSPTLTFDRKDEVGRVSDLAKFDNSGENDEGDNILYAWRVTGCDSRR